MRIAMIAFIVLALVQWLLPGWMIWSREGVLSGGKEFKFIVAPIDPENPFKGRYIRLDFAAANYVVPNGAEFKTNEVVYVQLIDSSSFAGIREILKVEPKTGDYVEATVITVSEREGNDMIWLKYPFEEFYMEESKAPVAEEVYQKSLSDSTKVTYALVSVLKGKAVLRDVFVNDKRISDLK